jgi:3-dehydroquinate dehydratase-1
MQRRRFLISSAVAAATLPAVIPAFATPTVPVDSGDRAGDGGRSQPLRIRDLEIGSGAPKIIASITGTDAAQALDHAQRIAATAQVDIAELRLDYQAEVLDHGKMTALVADLLRVLGAKPLLVTFRSKTEGGEREIAEADYFALYGAILAGEKIDLLDIEMFKSEARITQLIGQAHALGVAVILSSHDFHQTPARQVIIDRLRHQQALGADVLKIAVMPQRPEDVLTLMSASQEVHARYARRPLLTMAMGPLGVTSRIAGELTGSALTYASVGSASAPGQLQAERLHTVLEIIDQGSRS